MPVRATAAVVLLAELLLMVSRPVAAPVVVGSNLICSAILWVGFRVTGRLSLTMVNPGPVIADALTFTGEPPVELSVIDCVVAVFTVTVPKLRLDGLIVSCGFVEDPPPPQEGEQSALKRANS